MAGTTYAGTAVVFALAHFEVRYLYHVQATALVLAFAGLCLALEQRRAAVRLRDPGPSL